jgi:hypothetical protein
MIKRAELERRQIERNIFIIEKTEMADGGDHALMA